MLRGGGPSTGGALTGRRRKKWTMRPSLPPGDAGRKRPGRSCREGGRIELGQADVGETEHMGRSHTAQHRAQGTAGHRPSGDRGGGDRPEGQSLDERNEAAGHRRWGREEEESHQWEV